MNQRQRAFVMSPLPEGEGEERSGLFAGPSRLGRAQVNVIKLSPLQWDAGRAKSQYLLNLMTLGLGWGWR